MVREEFTGRVGELGLRREGHRSGGGEWRGPSKQGLQQDGRGVGQEEWEVASLWPTVGEEISGEEWSQITEGLRHQAEMFEPLHQEGGSHPGVSGRVTL